MNLAQRRLARHQHQAAALLEHHVGGARDEVVAQARRDAGQRLHAAGHDDHAVDAERAAGDGGGHVVDVVDVVGQRAHVGRVVVGLVLERLLGPLGDDEVRLDVEAAQGDEQLDAQDGAGGARHGDDDALAARLGVRSSRSAAVGDAVGGAVGGADDGGRDGEVFFAGERGRHDDLREAAGRMLCYEVVGRIWSMEYGVWSMESY